MFGFSSNGRRKAFTASIISAAGIGSFKNHKKNFKENIKVSVALGDKFKITNEKGGIVMQRSHGSEFDTVWLSADKKEAQKVADWLKSEGAEIVLFGPKTRSFVGSKQEFIDRYL